MNDKPHILILEDVMADVQLLEKQLRIGHDIFEDENMRLIVHYLFLNSYHCGSLLPRKPLAVEARNKASRRCALVSPHIL